MDAETILRIRPALTEYLHEFDGCLGRVTNRGHAAAYVVGQLSDLDRKSIEPMADAAGVPVRKVQRAERVTVHYQAGGGAQRTLVAGGLLAVCIQHELDHLNGTVFVDHLSQLKQTRIRSKLAKLARVTA